MPDDDKNSMEVGIERDNNPTGNPPMLKDVGVRRSGHPDLADMRTINTDGTELLGRITRQSLIEQNKDF
jgi:hypothetical protein